MKYVFVVNTSSPCFGVPFSSPDKSWRWPAPSWGPLIPQWGRVSFQPLDSGQWHFDFLKPGKMSCNLAPASVPSDEGAGTRCVWLTHCLTTWEQNTGVECVRFLQGPNVIRVLLLLELNAADSCSLLHTLLVFWSPTCLEDNVINDPGHSGSCLRRPFVLPQDPVVWNADPCSAFSLCFSCKAHSAWCEESTSFSFQM